MKEITIHCTWKSDHTAEVPDDWEFDGKLSSFPKDVLDDLTPVASELVDFEVNE